MKEENDNSMQFIYQSIQHLKASVGMTFDLESGGISDDDEIAVVRTAAIHNLGLAYIALDGMNSSEGKSSHHFRDWVTLLRESQSHNSVVESWVFSLNEGALLLQSGEMEEAILSLETTAREVCSDSTRSSSRQNEACLIVKQNLMVAREALSGEQDQSILRKSEGAMSTFDAVAQWNADVSVGAFAKAEPSDNIVNATTLSEDGNNETSSFSGEETDTQAQPDKSAIEEQAKEDESDIDLPPAKKVKPELQSALVALEKAVGEGPQRTRVLLALARARSSAGDSAGAVDATVKAISAANTDEESETSSAYLEKLMEKMSEDEDTVQVVEEEHALEKAQQPPSFVGSKDFALTELQLKLELERLKYKVLEQEMKLAGRLQHPSQYANEKMRVIDFQQEEDDTDHDPSRRRKSDVSEETIPVNKAIRKPLKHETMVDDTEQATPVDEVEESTEATLKEETEESENQESGDNQISIESESVGASNETESSTEAITTDATDGVESNQNEASPEENESSINATEMASEEEPVVEETAIVEPVVEEPAVEVIELPSLYEPTLTSPKAIP